MKTKTAVILFASITILLLAIIALAYTIKSRNDKLNSISNEESDYSVEEYISDLEDMPDLNVTEIVNGSDSELSNDAILLEIDQAIDSLNYTDISSNDFNDFETLE